MRATFILTIGLFLCLSSKAQLSEPVHWSFKSEKISADIYKLVLTAQIDEGWYVYSQEVSGSGPLPMRIQFDNNSEIVFEGKPIESGLKKTVFDQNFNMTVTRLLGKTTYEQFIKITGNKKNAQKDSLQTVKGQLVYMTCNDEICLPPKKLSFNISLNPL